MARNRHEEQVPEDLREVRALLAIKDGEFEQHQGACHVRETEVASLHNRLEGDRPKLQAQ